MGCEQGIFPPLGSALLQGQPLGGAEAGGLEASEEGLEGGLQGRLEGLRGGLEAELRQIKERRFL